MKLYFDDEAFDGQLQRTVAKADSGMANVGECLYIASLITPGDRDSWYRAWSSFADGLVDQADAALTDGHQISARRAYLRATEYYRQAFFWHRDNFDCTELATAHRASMAAFQKSLPLFDHPARDLEGKTPGYFFAPVGDGPFPTILHIGGYDDTAEESATAAFEAIERGWAIACLEGPGTGRPLYERHEYQRPDWEHVVPDMVDLLLEQTEVDPARIVLVGRSFGGLIAPRGASGEPRLAALVADPGQIDLAQGMPHRLGDLWNHVDDPAADAKFEALLRSPAMKTLLTPRMATHGMPTVRGYFAELRRYNGREQAPTITCPSLITDNETDLVSTGQGQELFDALTCPKEFRRFRKDEGAEGHCEGMAPGVFWAAAFDWLDHAVTGSVR